MDPPARALRERIRYTASELCRELDQRHPITVSGGPSCYDQAMYQAMYQANQAIADARGGDSDDYRARPYPDRSYDRARDERGYDNDRGYDNRGYNDDDDDGN